jgi:FkbM family methyltransferase
MCKIFKRLVNVFQSIYTFKNWPDYLLDSFGFKENVVFLTRAGVKYKTRSKTADKGVINEVWFKKVYTPPGFELKDGDMVVDVGSLIGDFTLFASYHSPNGKVFAFEPFPDSYKLLTENINLNRVKNIKTYRLGICGSTGKRRLYINEKNTGGHSLISHGGKHVDINCITLAEAFKMCHIDKCNFLKMDCEGAEYEIIMKTPASILKRIDKISMEHHGKIANYDVGDIRNRLSKAGFEIYVCGHMLYARRKYLKFPSGNNITVL